jgi:hypothetical protein
MTNWERVSNLPTGDYKSAALPTELHQHKKKSLTSLYSNFFQLAIGYTMTRFKKFDPRKNDLPKQHFEAFCV